MLLSVRNLNFEPAKKATKCGECTDKMFAGPAKSRSNSRIISSCSFFSSVCQSGSQRNCLVLLQCRKQRKNSAKQWHKKHEKHTLHASSPRGLYTHTHWHTHTHWRTHMETITKRRLKPFWKGADNRTKQKPNVQNKTKRQKPLSLSVPVSVRP